MRELATQNSILFNYIKGMSILQYDKMNKSYIRACSISFASSESPISFSTSIKVDHSKGFFPLPWTQCLSICKLISVASLLWFIMASVTAPVVSSSSIIPSSWWWVPICSGILILPDLVLKRISCGRVTGCSRCTRGEERIRDQVTQQDGKLHSLSKILLGTC